jgi:hypothetical protein
LIAEIALAAMLSRDPAHYVVMGNRPADDAPAAPNGLQYGLGSSIGQQNAVTSQQRINELSPSARYQGGSILDPHDGSDPLLGAQSQLGGGGAGGLPVLPGDGGRGSDGVIVIHY